MSMYSNPLLPPSEVPASVPKPYARVSQAESLNKSCSQSMRMGGEQSKPVTFDLREDESYSADSQEVSYKDIHLQYPNFPLFRQNLSSSVHGFNTFSSYDCGG